MKIEECFDKRLQINISQMARLTGYSRNHIQGVLARRYNPGKKFKLALEKISFDDVRRPKNWRDDPEVEDFSWAIPVPFR